MIKEIKREREFLRLGIFINGLLMRVNEYTNDYMVKSKINNYTFFEIYRVNKDKQTVVVYMSYFRQYHLCNLSNFEIKLFFENKYKGYKVQTFGY